MASEIPKIEDFDLVAEEQGPSVEGFESNSQVNLGSQIEAPTNVAPVDRLGGGEKIAPVDSGISADVLERASAPQTPKTKDEYVGLGQVDANDPAMKAFIRPVKPAPTSGAYSKVFEGEIIRPAKDNAEAGNENPSQTFEEMSDVAPRSEVAGSVEKIPLVEMTVPIEAESAPAESSSESEQLEALALQVDKRQLEVWGVDVNSPKGKQYLATQVARRAALRFADQEKAA